jgi:hypothetical protein
MGISKFNPFKTDRQNFPGVVIPLADAPAHHGPGVSDFDEKKAIPDDKSLDRASSSENGAASGSLPETSHLTIEILRAEVEAEVATSGHDSVYDRMCILFRFPPIARSPTRAKSALFH